MKVSRILPAKTQHPREYLTLTSAEVKQLPLKQMEQAPSLTRGHVGTVVYYTDGEVRGLVVEVKFDRGEPDYFLLSCSFEPTFGVDRYDGMRIEDTEAFAVAARLGWSTEKLRAFGGQDSISTEVYLRARGSTF